LALDCALRGFKFAPDNAMNEFALAMAYMFNRQWVLGLKHLEARFAYRLRNYLQYPYPKWDGAADKQVFLASDQGIGDTLSFSSAFILAGLKTVPLRVEVYQQPASGTVFRASCQRRASAPSSCMPRYSRNCSCCSSARFSIFRI
jgi:hypothetical protein